MSPLVASRHRARVFVLLALVLGLGFVVINPPYAVNDEDVHLARVYELAGGRLFTRCDASGEYHYVPRDYVALAGKYEPVHRQADKPRVELPQLWRELTAPREPVEVRMSARAGGYSPIGYGPQLLAVWLMRQLDVGALVHLYAARVASLLEYITFAWLAVLVSAELQWVFIALALTPMALTQAAGVSTDGTVLGLTLLFFALAAKAICLQQRLPRRELAVLALTGIVLTLCKPVYIAAVACLPALLWTQPETRLRTLLLMVAITALGLGAYVGWSALIPPFVGPSASPYDAVGQVVFMRDHPLTTLTTALRTIYLSGDALITELVFVRRRLSWMIHFSPAIAVLVYVQLLLGLAWGSLRRAFPGDRRTRLIATGWWALTGSAIVFAAASAIYACCTRVGADRMTALQGRYFLPALPPLLLACALVGRPVVARWLRAGQGLRAYAIITFANLWCLFTLLGFHYYTVGAEWPL